MKKIWRKKHRWSKSREICFLLCIFDSCLFSSFLWARLSATGPSTENSKMGIQKGTYIANTRMSQDNFSPTDWLKLIKMAIRFHQMVQTTETTQTVTQTRRVFTPEHEAQTRDQSFEIPNWAVRVSLGANVGLAGIIVIMMYFYCFWNSSI